MRSRLAPKLVAPVLGLFTFLGAMATPDVALADSKRPAEKVGERVTRGVIDEALETLDTQENKARLGRIMGSDAMKGAMHDLTASIVRGVFDGVNESTKNMGKLDIAKSMGKGMDDHIGPAVGRMTGKIVDSALTASLSDKHIERIEKLARGGTHAAIAGVADGLEQDLGPALAVTLEKQIGPAVANMIEHEIMPAVGRGLDSPEMQSAIANTTRSIATSAVIGGDEGLDINKEKAVARGEEPTGLQVFGGIALGYAIAVFVAFALGTTLIVITVLLVRSNRRQRVAQAAAEKRETALLALLDRLDQDHPAARTVARDIIREDLVDSQG